MQAMLITLISLACGLALLIGGGELLVRGAVRIAEHMRLSPLLIGITIVSLGTSAPELATSVQAALAGAPGIAIGNIVGSNLANLLLILGVAALLAPIAVERGPLWRDGGVGLGAAAALLAAGHMFGLDRIVGALFLAAVIAYVFFAYRQETRGVSHSAAYDKAMAAEQVDAGLVPKEPTGGLFLAGLLFVAGLGLIVGGAALLVGAAVTLAERMGISDAVIGLTVVAVGTSLPELITSAVAALRKQSELALGNVLGSNIFNILFIGGATGLVAPTQVPAQIFAFDLWILIAASSTAMVFAWTGGRIGRREGAILVAAYGLYTMATAGLF
jgi:cation:H+ antiporter